MPMTLCFYRHVCSCGPLDADKIREDGSATDHQPPGQPLETDSQLMEITQTHTHTHTHELALKG